MNPMHPDGQLPVLYRRRYIPDEIVRLTNDEILFTDEDIILTKWKVLRPKRDFSHGRSCYFFKRGFKVSKFMNDRDEVIYTYCDIIETVYDEKEHAYIFNDLLLDVIIYNDGFVKVLDVGEVADALDQKLITLETAKKALRLLDELLELIYAGKFCDLCKCL